MRGWICERMSLYGDGCVGVSAWGLNGCGCVFGTRINEKHC